MNRIAVSLTFAITTLLALPSVVPAEEEAERVYRLVQSSVVLLENAEGHATGVVLEEGGLILTNAHAIMSPLPLRAHADVPDGAGFRAADLGAVQLVGVHPYYDLALVRVKPATPSVKLKPIKMSRAKVAPGTRVYAIGNPGAGGKTLSKTITSGMLSAADRDLDGRRYLQFSAAINPGNSGGPLCDKTGEVLGLVTFKLADLEAVGFAIPLREFKKEEFVRLQDRLADKDRAREFFKLGDRFCDLADEVARTAGLEDPRRAEANATALAFYHIGLLHDPLNPVAFYNAGMVLRTLDVEDVALAYLARSVFLAPWQADNAISPYREMGFCYIKGGHGRESMICYREGLAKFPRKAGRIWEDMAISFGNEENHEEAAYAAKVALSLGNCRTSVVADVYRERTARLSPEQLQSLRARELEIPSMISGLQVAASDCERAGRPYVTKAFEELMRGYPQPETNGAPPKGKPPVDPSTPDPAPKEVETPAKWISSRLSLANNFHRSGKKPRAIEVLQEILKRYPDEPEAKEVKRLLAEWQKR